MDTRRPSAIEQAWRAAWFTPDRRDIVQWASENIKFGPSSPFPGMFNVENVPWTRRWYEAWQDPKVRHIVISASPQTSGKTIMAQVCLAWQAVNDPAPMAFYADTGIKAGQFRESRWTPMQDACDALGRQVQKDTKAITTFKDGTFMLILGAESEANRQSHTLRIVVKDEAYKYEPGWSEEIDNRTKAFQRTNDWKVLELGTGGTVGHDFANNHALGTREVYEVPCEHCGEHYDYKWDVRDGGVFRFTEVTREDGSIDYLDTKKSVHIECPHCKGRIDWNPTAQRAAVLAGRWRATNPDADGTIASFTMPEFVPGKSWPDFVERWIRIGKGRNVGQRHALKEIITKGLGEFWEDRPIVEKKDLRLGDYTREDMLTGKWDREVVRFATIDHQHGLRGDRPHFWFSVRAYSVGGDSRLVDCGRVDELNDLEQRIKAAGVGSPHDSFEFPSSYMDCAFNTSTVYGWCADKRWGAVRGEHRKDEAKGGQYLHIEQYQKNGPKFRVWKSYSPAQIGQAGVGKRRDEEKKCIWFAVNNQAIEDILYELRTGKALDWTIPSDIEDWCPEYAAHINSHAKINVSKDQSKEDYRWTLIGNPESNPDHLYDCEKYQVGVMLRHGLTQDISEEKE